MSEIKYSAENYVGKTNARGQRHGFGTCTYENGNRYEGDWVNDQRDGNGTMTYASGGKYVGECRHNKNSGIKGYGLE